MGNLEHAAADRGTPHHLFCVVLRFRGFNPRKRVSGQGRRRGAASSSNLLRACFPLNLMQSEGRFVSTEKLVVCNPNFAREIVLLDWLRIWHVVPRSPPAQAIQRGEHRPALPRQRSPGPNSPVGVSGNPQSRVVHVVSRIWPGVVRVVRGPSKKLQSVLLVHCMHLPENQLVLPLPPILASRDRFAYSPPSPLLSSPQLVTAIAA